MTIDIRGHWNTTHYFYSVYSLTNLYNTCYNFINTKPKVRNDPYKIGHCDKYWQLMDF